eukprot:2816244-Prymnesium_polylepis.1
MNLKIGSIEGGPDRAPPTWAMLQSRNSGERFNSGSDLNVAGRAERTLDRRSLGFWSSGSNLPGSPA